MVAMNPHVRLLEMKHWNSSDIKNKNTIYWLGIKPELNYKLVSAESLL